MTSAARRRLLPLATRARCVSPRLLVVVADWWFGYTMGRAMPSNNEVTAPPSRGVARQYSLSLCGLVAAALLRLPFESLLQGHAPYALYFPVLVATAWLCGAGPTLLAVAVAPALSIAFAPEALASEAAALPSLGIYVITALSLILLSRRASGIRHIAERSRHAAERLAAIVESSDDAIVGKELNGIVRSWNRGAERIFGYAPDEMIGRPIEVLIPPERRSEETEILATLRRGERVDHFETVRIAKDGRSVDVSLSISPIRDEDGTIVGASKIARDVTQRKQSERALEEQREWFRVTLASIGDAVITTDRDGCVTFMNTTAERLTGWSLAEAVGQNVNDVFKIVHEKTRAPAENPCEKVVRHGMVLGLANHTALIARDGSEHPIEDSAAPIVDAKKSIIGVVLVFHDVAERRRVEAALAEQREWLETTLFSIGDAVIATDIHSRVVFMNPVAEHMTGWRNTDAKGRECAEVFRIVNESTRLTVESPIARVLREGVVVGLANHTVLIARDGAERPIDDSAAPIRGADGRITGVVLVFHDVSERRMAELARQSAAHEREQLLQSERAARSEAERANRSKDDFLAMLSHELRTPLHAILGWTEILQRENVAPEALERGLGIIERNTRLQAQLVSDLLDVSRIVAGKLRLELQLVDLVAAVGQAIDTIKQHAEAKRIALDVSLDDSIESIAGDAVRLQQIAWNLMSNAIKFSPEGSTVRVSLQREGTHARLVVADAGVGIAPEFLPHLFDRFRQADASIARRFGGLGLGLTIVKQLVELHGGTVDAHSQGEGCGATFVITLPLSSVHGLGYARSPTSLSESESSRLRHLHVLLIEDDADSREVITRLLSEVGCRVTAVGTASAALPALVQERVDVLISDIGLPGEDGYSLMESIRRLTPQEGGAVPAIALTAFVRPEDRARALRAGFQAHIAKPVDSAELFAVLANLANLIAR